MRLVILSFIAIILSSCAMQQHYKIKNFTAHMFSDDANFITQSIACNNTYLTDKFDTVNNEIFRCSNYTGSVFLEIESNGNNAEEIKQTTLIWKNWNNSLREDKLADIDAKKYAAVMARLYAPDRQIELLDSYFLDQPSIFTNVLYNIKTSTEKTPAYTLRKMEVIFTHPSY